MNIERFVKFIKEYEKKGIHICDTQKEYDELMFEIRINNIEKEYHNIHAGEIE